MDFVAVGLFEAVVAAVIMFFFGKEAVKALTAVGSTLLVLPILVIFVVATTEMMNATTPGNVTEIGNDAITRIVEYITNKLPGVVASEAWGAIIGAPVGFVLGLIFNKDT